ncbi:MAG: nitrogen fixation protein NifM, partial [Thiohalocapsa sp.]
PEYRYHLLRAATERFESNIPALDSTQRAEAERQARQTFALEDLVLSSEEAQGVVIPDDQVKEAYQAIAGRYDDELEFDADLARNGLDTNGLRLALGRELVFDAVMQRVAATQAAITETDERLFYELHHERFAVPERRTARHILITINDDFAENTRTAARARLDAIADKLRPDSMADNGNAVQRFARLARRYSECPTALEDGKLSTLIRGQAYPAVDAALFALEEGAVSKIVESPVGFHLVLCERIQASRFLAFNQVRERIRAALEKRNRRETQRAWLADLRERRAAAA